MTAAAALVVAACGGGGDGGEDGPVTLTVTTWDAAEEEARDPYLQLVEQFEEEHPDITIEQEPIPFSDIEQQLLQRVQAGNAPDVTQLAGNYTFNLNAAGALEPLDELAGDEYLDQIVPEVRELVTVEDELISAPWALQPVGFWYNKDILAEAGLDPESPPATIDELLQQLEIISQEMPDVIPLGIDSTNRVFGLDVNWPWMTTFGAQPIADGAAAVNTPEMAEYLEFMRTLAQEGYTEVNQPIGYYRPLAADGSVAFVWDQPIMQAVIQQTSGIEDEAFHEQWGVTTLPTGASGEPASVAQDHQFGILASSENKEAAWTFVEWMTRSDTAMEHVVANKGALPPISEPTGTAAEMIDQSPALQAWSDEVIPTLVGLPWGPDYGSASEPIMVGVQQMMTSDRAVQDVADEMQGQLESELQ
ncbi:MAG TPA: sugar ABC transporter substrate-binding protein [Jiangellaceae bacterium]|nr:sugar ABC transporter substrate-binding protein [Jiangellaceae bacterium]